MIRKLFISAAVLAALIYGKEASAAGPGGFARDLASVVVRQVATDKAIGEVDAYIDSFAGEETRPVVPSACFDCIVI